ncbi:MAG: preprotein translocase subunit SecE [Verrucomicrobia bacterium]|nr:preprotein translocase subunit SecE [Verrucomicrobiota bacterium]
MHDIPLVAVSSLVWYVVLLVGAIGLLALAIRNNWFVRIQAFLADVRAELKKVSWPTWPELRSATAVVIVSTLVVTVFIVLVDLVLSHLMRLLF